MSVGDHKAIDYVFIDNSVDCFVLALVELRPWGTSGELLPDLRAKLQTYLSFVLNGRIPEMYPESRGKNIGFRLVHGHPLTERETTFVEAMRREHLDRAGILWQQELNDPHGV